MMAIFFPVFSFFPFLLTVSCSKELEKVLVWPLLPTPGHDSALPMVAGCSRKLCCP